MKCTYKQFLQNTYNIYNLKSQNRESITHIINSKTLWLYLPRLFCETRNFIFCVSHNANDAYCRSIRISFFLFLHRTLIWHLGSFHQTTDTRKYFTDDLHCKVFSPWNAMSSLCKYLFFLFSIAIKRIVYIASTTQTTAYLLACNYTDISILLTLAAFSWH